MKYFSLVFIFFISFGCGKIPGEQEIATNSFQQSTAANYFQKVSQVKIHVYYESGAEPFVGNQINGRPLWGILDQNMEQIFSYRSQPPSVTLPSSLDQMNQLPSQNKSSWSTQAVYDLYLAHNKGESDSNQAKFYVYFVNGYASSSNSIIGFNIGETPIVVIFKDVIRGTGGAIVQRYVEQSTLVHEMGHALGLVNNGLPMKQNHQDPNHGAHTSNSDCVMYYLNEGASDMASFVGQFISGGDVTMWGPEVLNDVQNFSK